MEESERMKPEPLKIELTPEAYEDLKRIAKKIKEIDEFKEIDEKVIIRLLAVTFVTFKLREKSAVQWLLKEIEKEIEEIENLKPIYNNYGNYEDWSCPVCKMHFREETKAYEHVEWEKRELRKTKGKMLEWLEDRVKKAFEGVIE